jgi:hypothetical protein
MKEYIPEHTSGILYIRGEYVGECANRYADAHCIAKLGYPNFREVIGTEREAEAFTALVDGAQHLLVLYHTPSVALEAAQKYARLQGKEVYAYCV